MRRVPAGWARRYLLPVVALGLVVGIVAVAFDPRAIGRELASADLVPFAAGFGVVVIAMTCWSEAHRHLLARLGGPLSPKQCLLVFATGMFARLALPVGYASGAAVLAYGFARQSDADGSRALASVTVVEVLSILVSGGLAAAAGLALLAALPSRPIDARSAGGAALATTVLVVLGVAGWRHRGVVRSRLAATARWTGDRADRLTARIGLPGPTTRFADRADRLTRAFAAVGEHPRAVATAIGLMLVGWLIFSLALQTSAIALGHRLPLAVVLFAVPVAGYASVLPTPGGLGGYEAAMAGTLHFVAGVEPATALAVTLLFRLPSYWFPLLAGALASAYISGAYPSVTSR